LGEHYGKAEQGVKRRVGAHGVASEICTGLFLHSRCCPSNHVTNSNPSSYHCFFSRFTRLLQIGMAGVEGQGIYMLAVGYLLWDSGLKSLWANDYRNYSIFVGLWTWVYLKGYAIHLYYDPTADFAYMTRCPRT